MTKLMANDPMTFTVSVPTGNFAVARTAAVAIR